MKHMYSVVAAAGAVSAADVSGAEYTLVVYYLRWQGLGAENVVFKTLAEVRHDTHGQLHPSRAFYVLDPDGNMLWSFHDVVADVQRRGLVRI